MSRSLREDPYLSFRFVLAIDGKHSAGFNEVTGLTFETQVESFREGGFNAHERQLFGPTTCPEKLVLKRGLSGKKGSNELWQWYKKVLAGQLVREDLTITLQDYDGEAVPAWQWVFMRACPVKWTGPQFKAGTAEVAFETIELIHKGLKPG
ncbi:phage tail protein [Nitrosomonas sp.]|uniref:phage tail protein n=1 Tax=Nitrosomonas sp. TaxID=42353 RepID=UPI0020840E06|nr:phage tail protein [Nitrosomonas sp.]GJL74448.1 MAG: phage tail protein [Nitrosomonas sp.]